ncbi:phospholipase domain-containing protein [Streptomyces sp. C10]|uniref:phospholipase domain-containing protein n=1 Tax=Streptomyces sp. C10 TaxID=531941 RepID=UPI00397F6AAC
MISDIWSTGSSNGTYKLTVHGPNGYLRTYEGTAATASPEVTGHHDENTARIKLTLTNPAKTACHLTVAHAYGGKSSKITIGAGGRQTRWIDLGHSKRWYDLHIRSDNDSTYLRRLAGHVGDRRARHQRPRPPDLLTARFLKTHPDHGGTVASVMGHRLQGDGAYVEEDGGGVAASTRLQKRRGSVRGPASGRQPGPSDPERRVTSQKSPHLGRGFMLPRRHPL